MKQQKIILIAILCVSMLVFAACNGTDKTSETSQSGAVTDTTGNTSDTSSMNGIITELTDTSITIAQNPMGAPGGGGNVEAPQAPDGTKSANDSGNAPPAGDNNSLGQKQDNSKDFGNPPEGGNIDTSNWEKVTYTIDDQTKIMKQVSGDGATSTESGISISELAVGTMVRITPRGSDTTIADEILIVEGKGGAPDLQKQPSDNQ